MEAPMLAGWEVPTLIVGITQTIKNLIEGKEGEPGHKELTTRQTTTIALVVGGIVLVPAVGIADGWIAGQVAAAVVSVTRVVGYMASVPGWYSTLKDEFIPAAAGAIAALVGRAAGGGS